MILPTAIDVELKRGGCFQDAEIARLGNAPAGKISKIAPTAVIMLVMGSRSFFVVIPER